MAQQDDPNGDNGPAKTVHLTPGKPTETTPLTQVSTATPKAVVVKVAAAVETAMPADTSTPSDETPTVAVDDSFMKKTEFLDKVATRANVKRADVKAAMDAAFAVLGEELIAGSELQLPPLGKLKVMKSKPAGKNGAMALTLKLRTPNTNNG
jgi:nucleoid DNA-binding protein